MEQERRMGSQFTDYQNRRGALSSSEARLPEEFLKRNRIVWQNVERRIVQESDDKKLQEILDNLPIASLAAHVRNSRDNGTPLALDFLKGMLEDEGYSVRPGNIKSALSTIVKAGIPIKREATGQVTNNNGKKYPQIYTVIILRHKDRIIEALKTDPKLFAELNDNPVELAYGPKPDHFPKTTELWNRKVCARVDDIINKYFTMLVSGENVDLLVGSPVSIFSTSKGIFCSLGDLKKFLPFLERRLGELERIK